MKTVIVTGASGLIGAETCRLFDEKGFNIVGIDNNMRSYFFGDSASTIPEKFKLETQLKNYTHFDVDIRDYESIIQIFKQYNSDIDLIVHTAAQPSHDWAAKEPFTDFHVNATGTINLLEATRNYCPNAVFIFTSTNKVYGDRPNFLPLTDLETRWEIDEKHPYYKGIDESMSIDNTKHSLFGASKVSADVLTQEYGKYFGLKTGIFRGGCLTGPTHKGAELHGFLSYLVTCAVKNKPYTIFGYLGKQVRDNIHSKDLINAFWHFYNNPKQGEIYNIGGGRFSNISVLEAIQKIDDLSGFKLNYKVSNTPRIGDHMWYVTDISKFKNDYPGWDLEYNTERILTEILTAVSQSV